jgi:hypothetical protein
MAKNSGSGAPTGPITLDQLPDTIAPYLSGTVQNGVQVLTWDEEGFFNNVTVPRLKALPGWVNNDTVVLGGSLTWVARGTSTPTGGGGNDTPPTETGSVTDLTVWPVIVSANFTGNDFAAIDEGGGVSNKKLPVGATGYYYGKSTGGWFGVGTDGTYKPNGPGDFAFCMKQDPQNNKILVKIAGQQIVSDEVQGRSAVIPIRIKITPTAYIPQVYTGSAWVDLSGGGIVPYERAAVELWAKVQANYSEGVNDLQTQDFV